MTRPGTGDVLLRQLVTRRGWLDLLLTLLVLVAAFSLYLRVWLGRPGSVPWWGALLGLYGIAMLALSREGRCRAAWLALTLLATASFLQHLPAGLLDPVRLRGAVESAAAAALVVVLVSMARGAKGTGGAVLESAPSRHDDSPAARPPEPRDDAEVK